MQRFILHTIEYNETYVYIYIYIYTDLMYLQLSLKCMLARRSVNGT